MHDFWKKLNTETAAEVILLMKIGVVVLVKKWIELFSETAYSALKRHKRWLLAPVLILQLWFPIAAIIDLCYINRYGLLAMLWACVDIYMTCFLSYLIGTFLKQLRAEIST